ncbi:MAG TPA: oligoendopeptidase F [Vicinamibacterales bacterium]|nr:oligoendopeptidase F [Vicinamibacterales bacterium]
MFFDPSDVATPEPPTTRSRRREEIAERFKWNLHDIFPNWEEWDAAYKQLEAGIDKYAALKGTLASGPAKLLEAFRLSEELGQLAYRVWYFPSLRYDEDQRDNAVNAKRQQVQILFARWKQAESWFNPELLLIPLATVREWMDKSEPLNLYRFAIEDLYRQQEHVLDEKGERLMSLASRLASSPNESYWALSTADAKFPKITLSTGEEITVSYGQYRAILATRRAQADREKAFLALHDTYQATLNTYATLYNGVCQRDWFQARARGYTSTLEGALHGDNIPPSVVENLIETTRAGVEPLRRYHRLRRRALGVPSYHVFDFSIPLVSFDKKYEYEQVLDWIVDAVAPLGAEYQARMRQGFGGGWIDVYENDGKRSGAYSAPVYGTHPYMLLNYTDTLDDVFTLAHEMGHSMHTILSHETQPFVYSSYTIFVAEVPSTLSEALLLDYMLERSTDPIERIVLLQHAIDNITSTFYTQVLFADYELRAHRLAEQDKPITAEILTDMYRGLLTDYYGDALDLNPQTGITWARIPHFFNSPYYVYQYATCFASAARIAEQIMRGEEPNRLAARERFLTLLRSGGSDYPMEQLRRAGIDLSQPDTVRAIVNQLDDLVTRLEGELRATGALR